MTVVLKEANLIKSGERYKISTDIMTNRSERAFDSIECAVMLIYIVIKHQHLPHRRS